MPNQATDKFFEIREMQHTPLTYDDILLKPRYSEVLADLSSISLRSRFSRNVVLVIPLVSAAMDTVTEYRMAIAMAKSGGIGTIHRGMNPGEQAAQVAKVKHHLHGRIDKPITMLDTDTVDDVQRLIKERDYEFESFPILGSNGKLVGLVTGNDLKFATSTDRLVNIMTQLPDLILAEHNTSKAEALALMRAKKVKVIPLVDPSGILTGMFAHKDLLRTISGTTHNVDHNGRLRVAAAIGVGPAEIERAIMLANSGVDALVIDTAHGHTPQVAEMIKALKTNANISCDIVAGNISTAEAAKFLADAGADGVRVGQGPGSICTTRIITGMGVPQATAVYECARALRNKDVPVCADGGIRSSGHIVIALALGASSVTLGGMLAGTDEAPGDVFTLQGGQQVKTYRGMGSLGAMRDRQASRDRYGQRGVPVDKLVPEGVEGAVPYKGPLEGVITQLVGGVRAGFGYQGANNISTLQNNAHAHRITYAGASESHPHDLTGIIDAPNYPTGRSQ